MAGIEDILGGLTGAQGGAGGMDLGQLQSMAGPLMEMVNQNGGLEGILAKLQSGGLGDLVSSWLGQGANAPVSPDQLSQALGADNVAQMASEAGVSPEQVSADLSTMLPGLVDQLSPNGELPSADDLSSILGGLFGGSK